MTVAQPESAWTLVLAVLGVVMAAAMFFVLVDGVGPRRQALAIAGIVVVALIGVGTLMTPPHVVARIANVSSPIQLRCDTTAVHAAVGDQGQARPTQVRGASRKLASPWGWY